MGRGEIVTLQLGHTASFVGSHFWNAQVSVATGPARMQRLIAYRRGRDRTYLFMPSCMHYVHGCI